MDLSLSITIGKQHNLQHNSDNTYRATLSNKEGYNIDPTASGMNIYSKGYPQTDKEALQYILNKPQIKQALETALDTYNHGKRKNRQLTMQDLTNQHKKQHIQLYEVVIQYGTKTQHPNMKECNELLTAAAKTFINNTPGAYPVAYAIHHDESTPHAHLTFTIIDPAPNRKRGLPLNLSLDTATGGGRSNFRTYRNDIEKALTEVAIQRGHTITNPHLGGRHTDPAIYNLYKQQNRELQRLQRELARQPFHQGRETRGELPPTASDLFL